MLDVLNNVAGILTALIAGLWFFYTRKINYYEKGGITGNYKAFETLIGRKSKNVTAIIEFKIDHISNKGWFTGRIDYSEIFRPPGARSEGGFNCIGYIKYSMLNDFHFFLKKPTANPLEYEKFKGYKGKLFIIARNDFKLNRNWKDFLLESFDILHYRNTFRVELYNKHIHSLDVKTQIPNSLILVNSDFVKDSLYEFNVKTEFTAYPPLED